MKIQYMFFILFISVGIFSSCGEDDMNDGNDMVMNDDDDDDEVESVNEPPFTFPLTTAFQQYQYGEITAYQKMGDSFEIIDAGPFVDEPELKFDNIAQISSVTFQNENMATMYDEGGSQEFNYSLNDLDLSFSGQVDGDDILLIGEGEQAAFRLPGQIVMVQSGSTGDRFGFSSHCYVVNSENICGSNESFFYLLAEEGSILVVREVDLIYDEN